MSGLRASVFCLIPCATPVFGADICNELNDLSEHVEAAVFTLPTTGESRTCKQSLTLSGDRQIHCSWSFDYRAEAAKHAFDRMIKEVAACLGNDARVTEDQDVNHPDFYDLTRFDTEGRTIAVSLKDKAALQQTYVFLRVTAP